MPVDQATLEWANWWYDFAGRGLLISGILAAVASCVTVAFAFRQWQADSIKGRDAEWRTVTLERETEVIKLEGEKLKFEAAEASRLAAEAIKRAEEEKLARIKIEARIAPRSIPQAEQHKLTEALRGLPIQFVTIKASPSLPESEMFARALAAPLQAAGWKITPAHGIDVNNTIFPTGVLIWYANEWSDKNYRTIIASEAANKLAALLKELGIDATALPQLTPMIPPTTMEITVSTK
jgi:hypothetical protein